MSLENRYACSPNEAKPFDTNQLRANFLISDIMTPDLVKGVYSHYDRMVTLGAVPVNESLKLPNFQEFTKQENFLDRSVFPNAKPLLMIENLVKTSG